MLLRSIRLLPALIALAAMYGCSHDKATPIPSGPPVMREIAPRSVANDRDALILLKGEGFRPGVRVAVGPNLVGRENVAGQTVAGRVAWVNEGLVAVAFAAGLPPGDYDVGVTNLDGQWAKLDAVLKIRAGGAPAQPSPSPAATVTATPTPTAAPTATPTPSPTPTPEPRAAPTATATPAPTPRPQPPPTRGPAPPTNPLPPFVTPGPITPRPSGAPTQGAQPERNPPEESHAPGR